MNRDRKAVPSTKVDVTASATIVATTARQVRGRIPGIERRTTSRT